MTYLCNNFLIILIKKLKKKKSCRFNIKDINFNYDKTKRLIIDDVSVCLIGEFRNRRITQTDRSR